METPYLDTASALAYLGGDLELYRSVLAGFITGYAGLKIDLGEPDTQRTLHTLKGLCGNVGAPRLLEITSRLYDQRDASLIPRFEEELAAVLMACREYLTASAEAGGGVP